jgi:hypothetical protein
LSKEGLTELAIAEEIVSSPAKVKTDFVFIAFRSALEMPRERELL